MGPNWIALTGTPGVGKTTVADRLRPKGLLVVDLARLYEDERLPAAPDVARETSIVEPGALTRRLNEITQKSSLALLEGHWAHDVPGVARAIVLRVHPRVLGRRLAARGWPASKIDENVEAEALDVVLQECVARFGVDAVAELEVTDVDARETARLVTQVIAQSDWAPWHPRGQAWAEDVF